MTGKAIKAIKCPTCKGEAVARFRPFCSKRCADIDLGRWFNEDYTVPAVEPPDEWDRDLSDEEGDGTDEKGGGYLN